MRKIKLTQGKFTIVDDEDYVRVIKHKWFFRNCGGYAYTRQCCIKNGVLTSKILSMHRFILGVKDSRKEVDHINQNSLDNRKINLRICSHAENMKNRKIHKNNTSGVVGVQKVNNRWRAIITVNNKKIDLGCFTKIDLAKEARLVAEKMYFGEFAPIR